MRQAARAGSPIEAREPTLSSDNEVLLTFLDDSIRRCLKTPYKYLEDSLHFVPSSSGEPISPKEAPSPLLVTLLEQLAAKVKAKLLSPKDAVVCRVRPRRRGVPCSSSTPWCAVLALDAVVCRARPRRRGVQHLVLAAVGCSILCSPPWDAASRARHLGVLVLNAVVWISSCSLPWCEAARPRRRGAHHLVLAAVGCSISCSPPWCGASRARRRGLEPPWFGATRARRRGVEQLVLAAVVVRFLS